MKKCRFLLLQIRDKPQVREEEYASFCEFGQLLPEQLDILNVFDTPVFNADVLTGYDALFVGGASEASVLEPENYPFLDPCVSLLQHCIETRFPTFASCFGFQLAVQALHGEIVRDIGDFEIGTLPISLTRSAELDPLMQGMPDPFFAVSVHRERAEVFPENVTPLAYTHECPHAFKVKDAPFWAFQFHPEVDKRILIERLSVFKTHYTNDQGHFEQVIEQAVETPESNHLVCRFVEIVSEITGKTSLL